MNSFDKIEPSFFIDDEMNNLLESIDIKLNHIKITDKQRRKYMIQKSRVRSIHSTLSIEANSLSFFDVENIVDNKFVLGRKEEIQEVKNAIEAYSQINKFNYKNEEDLLKVHQIMMRYFDDDNGNYRDHGEGVEKEGVIIYIAPDSILVPSLMKSLFEYINNSNLNTIILGAIFHYYFVFIHPFSDGNGRLARFWLSLILINYNNNFEFIPIEEEIYLTQKEYYSSIAECHMNRNANVFIKYILKTINSSLENIIKSNNFITNDIQNKIIELIVSNNHITQNEIAKKLNISIRTVKRNFKVLIDNNIIERKGSDKTGQWEILR